MIFIIIFEQIQEILNFLIIFIIFIISFEQIEDINLRIIIINNNLKYLKNYYYINYNKKKDVDIIRKNIIFYAKINKKN